MNEKKRVSRLVPSSSVRATISTPSDETSPSADHDGGTSTVPQNTFPIVGIGASAGGLGAFEAFFSGMPTDADPGMAFVLVQHLAPDHKSLLTELIQRSTQMKVYEVEDGMVVQPNCAYIIPPGRDMAFMKGTLQLLEPSAPRGQRLPIDFFFRSLAQDQHDLAIGIVLSGTGSDGTLGLRAIKAEGGMAMVQSPDSAEYDGMPTSAIATGLVDYELAPAKMPAQLMAYVAHAFSKPPLSKIAPTPKSENALKKLFILLRAQTGHDFSSYKPSTIHRRIERRMAVHQIETLEEYVQFMQHTPSEAESLFRDLLIGVTHFFRDKEAFKALEEVAIPRLFDGKPAGSVIRVWTPGCSTGEEAYSIAILLQERMEALRQSYILQVFATDLDSQAIATARLGIYPASIAAGLSPERLARFFTPESDESAYRIHKSIRDLLIFSEQDVIKDPPFSKIDLISCRNLLIYLGADLQRKLIPLFHYALNPEGILFLGTSESVGDFGDLFSALDRKSKLYLRKQDSQGTQRTTMTRFIPPMGKGSMAAPRVAGKLATGIKQPLRELTEQALLKQASLIGALVNGKGDILYLHGRAGLYLEPMSGEAGINNILKMARDGLRRELTTALHKAVSTKEAIQCPGLRVKAHGQFTTVNLKIYPMPISAQASLDTPLFMVILEGTSSAESKENRPKGRLPKEGQGLPDADSAARIAALTRELQAKDEFLQITNEELETSNEELKSSNEEMQSVNEELQSSNEELETSKEELQSVNEELSTVNAELQNKVADLSRANNDMNNLLAGTGIGTVFVDHRLNILRFTPSATRMINLIQSDVGRPVNHILSNLVSYANLAADTQAVLDTLIPKEIDVLTTDDKWYTMRIQVYRTLENVIEGAVITFVDITEMKRAEAALRESETLFRQLVGSLPQLTWMCRTDGLYDYVSPQWEAFTGVSEAQLSGSRWLDQVHPEDRERLTEVLGSSVAKGEPCEVAFRLRHHSGTFRRFLTRAIALRDASGRITKWLGLSTEITDSAQDAAEPSRKEGPTSTKRIEGNESEAVANA
ncbi:chemotaxis protein CheB [Geothrix limicola]